VYDRYQQPPEPEPDEPAPTWETFEPDKPRRGGRLGNRSPNPATRNPAARGTARAPWSKVLAFYAAIVAIVMVGALLIGLANTCR
jgi:hypothetical protein